MKHVFAAGTILPRLARRLAMLLALGAPVPAAWAQSFGPPTVYPAGTNSQPIDVAVGDVNGDGRPDIVTANYSLNSVSVLLGQAGGTFGARTSYPAGYNPIRLALGDVNGDGRLDVVTAARGDKAMGVLLGQAGGFAPVVLYPTGPFNSPNSVVLGDQNGDGRPDIVAVYDGELVGVLLGRPGGGFGPSTNYRISTNFRGAGGPALGDVNGDGRLDVVVANSVYNPSYSYPLNTVTVMLGQPGGGLAFGADYSTGPNREEPGQVLLRDVNNDGRLDMLVLNHWSSTLAVLLGQAGGTFGAVAQYPFPVGGQPYGMALGDVNGDGRPDAVAADANVNTVSVLPGQAGGTFGAAATFYVGGNPWAVALGDFNGDGRPDLATANNGTNNNSVLLNTGTFTPTAARPLVAADVALYPNPSRAGFAVRVPVGAVHGPAELVNAAGQVVRRAALAPGGGWFDTQGLSGGVYLLRVPTGDAPLVRRVVLD